MHFIFVKKIDTTKKSIFYSLVNYKKNILAVGRQFYNKRRIKFMLLDKNLNVKKDEEEYILKGEDPRCFYHNDDIYIQDNYWNDMYLINLTKNTKQKIDIEGKNITFISHNGKLYFIHYMCPFIMYEYCYDTGEIFPIKVNKSYEPQNEYRGGTPAYHYKDNLYYGFGHITYEHEKILYHDVFYWEVDFSKNEPKIDIWNIKQPPGCLNICDPTSIIEIDGIHYLVTAESMNPWFEDQEYETNVYRIVW